MNRSFKQRGFTLLEMLVAIAIFAVVAALAYGGLSAITRQKEITNAAQQRLTEVRRAVMLMERDIFQIQPRPVREAYQGDVQPAVRGGVSGFLPLEFTRGGWRNPAALPRSTLQRVAWRIEDGKLQRLSWTALDQAQDSQPQVLDVLDDARELSVRFLDWNRDWQEQWPPLESGTEEAPVDPNRLLPAAIEVTITLSNDNRIRRVVEVAGS